MKKKVLIIGGVACGPKAASRIKRLNPDAEVTILEKGELLSYAGCGLPYYISGEVKNDSELMTTPAGAVRNPDFFKMVKDIQVKNRTLAEAIDRENRIVKAVDLSTGNPVEYEYDSLVLSVGSQFKKPPFPGIDLTGVHFLQTVEDAKGIRDESGPLEGKNAVVIGAGLIGLEATESLRAQGMNITMIEMLDQAMGNMFDHDMVFHLHNELKKNNVVLKTLETVREIKGNDQSAVQSVVTDKGEYPADLVLVAVGVNPNTQLAKEAGLDIGETGAIRVDASMRTSDPDIYAGGDCVENLSIITGKPMFAPMGSTANKHGRVIGDNICGISSEFKGICGTAICRVFGINVSRTGLTETQAKDMGYDCVTVLSPAPDKPHFLDEAKLIVIKLVVDKATHKLLGAQIVGPGDVAKRMEVVVANISSGAKVTDIAQYDLAYAPPFSPAMDNIITAANIAENKLYDIGSSLSPVEVQAKIENGDDFIFLDVRSPKEFEEMRIEDPRVKLVPLGQLRNLLSELPMDKEIIAFCKISLRGYEAERILKGAGYTNIKYMDGGVVCWPYKKFVA
ncbi:MAG: FAD-dependent oxidoreductase [Desulfobacterales bacterium]|nr:FAD-dependent oxidoreductase [Desulfobacterales bacterium]